MNRAALTFTLFASPQLSAERLNLPTVGDHYRLLTFEKNDNPQNTVIIYSRLDHACRFQTYAAPVDVYWLMERSRFKPVHPLIKAAIKRRFKIESVTGSGGREIKVTPVNTTGLKEVVQLKVKSEGRGGDCRLETVFSDEHGTRIKVDSIYGETRGSLRPPFRTLVSFTVKGWDLIANRRAEKLYRTDR